MVMLITPTTTTLVTHTVTAGVRAPARFTLGINDDKRSLLSLIIMMIIIINYHD